MQLHKNYIMYITMTYKKVGNIRRKYLRKYSHQTTKPISSVDILIFVNFINPVSNQYKIIKNNLLK